MAENNRVVYPDEVEDVKAKAKENEATKTNTIEEATEPQTPTNISLRNMIQVPDNCPAGQKMDANGVCRDLF